MLLENIKEIKNGRIFTKDSNLLECPYCKSTFQRDAVRAKMKRMKDSFYTSKHCPNCDKRISLRDGSETEASIRRQIERLERYANQCRLTGDREEYQEAMKEISELKKQLVEIREGKTQDSEGRTIWNRADFDKMVKAGHFVIVSKHPYGYEVRVKSGEIYGVEVKDSKTKDTWRDEYAEKLFNKLWIDLTPAEKEEVMRHIEYDKYGKDSKTKDSAIGKHNDIPDEEFDAKELAMGIEIEMEHTDDAEIAKAIAKDHLKELSDYYTRLKKMEAGE